MTAMLEGMTSAMPPVEGRLLGGRYRLGSLLGTGGVAEVYRAIDERLHRGVAVKLFRTDVAETLHRHEEEMRLLARLNHPSLVTVYDTGDDEVTGQPYLVMALVEGATLAEQLRAGRLPMDRVGEIGASVADALAYVHGQGLIHRDVKPANVLISNAGRVFLADFGIARIVDSAHVTQAGDVLGTPAFFAPEQVSGEPVGPPADVYALGLVLLESITGQREYDGTSLEVAMARLTRPPQIPPSLPAGWRAVLTGMLARDPATRLSAAQVAEQLRRVDEFDERTQAIPVLAPEPSTVMMSPHTTVMPPVAAEPVAAQPELPRRRSRVPLVLLALVILAAVGVGVVLVEQDNSSGTRQCSTTTGPQLKGQLESDMQHIETLACR
jgi:serine/threonine protein kinase